MDFGKWLEEFKRIYEREAGYLPEFDEESLRLEYFEGDLYMSPAEAVHEEIAAF